MIGSDETEDRPVPPLEQQNADKRWAVRLRVYDLSRGMARTLSPIVLGQQIAGVWHTGVEVYGLEYFFGDGITSLPPADVERVFQLVPTRVILMGYTYIDKSLTDDYLRQITPRFREGTHNLLHWNCNHFSQELTQFLLNKSIPDYIQNQVQQVADTPRGRLVLGLMQQQQQFVQQAASAAGQRTLWSLGTETTPAVDTSAATPSSSSYSPARATVPTAAVAAAPGGGMTASLTAGSDTAAAVTGTAGVPPVAAFAPAAAVLAAVGSASAATGAAAPPQRWPPAHNPFGSVLRQVCTNQDLGYSTKYVFLLTLGTIIDNLLRPVRNPKFLRLKCGNSLLQSKLFCVPGGEEALLHIGFERDTSHKHMPATSRERGIVHASGDETSCTRADAQTRQTQRLTQGKNSTSSSLSPRSSLKRDNPSTDADSREESDEQEQPPTSEQDEFVFKQFEKGYSEQQVLTGLEEKKREIQAYLAALQVDRHRGEGRAGALSSA